MSEHDGAASSVRSDALMALMVRIYNSGYHAGHHDTVEAGYVDIHRDDMETYHLETVEEIIAEANANLMRNRPKDAVLAVYPSAVCVLDVELWVVRVGMGIIGAGSTAFTAWYNAQQNMKGLGK